jgi:SsrA-binding protein
MTPEPEPGRKLIASNRKARHEYHILDQWEAGIALTGPEVKSVRAGKVSFQDAFARIDGGRSGSTASTSPPTSRPTGGTTTPPPRKLLLRKDQIRKLVGKVEEKGLTLVPLDLHFRRGYVKVELALARGKQLHDKREALKKRTMEREARRAMARAVTSSTRGTGATSPGRWARGDPGEGVALAVALALARELEADPWIEVHLTRDRDVTVPIWGRGEQATAWKGDRPGVFVSIHANAVPEPSHGPGLRDLLPLRARTEHERRVAAAENAPFYRQGAPRPPPWWTIPSWRGSSGT